MTDYENQRYDFNSTQYNNEDYSCAMGDNTSTKHVYGLLSNSRLGFIRKVYLILISQLAITVGMTSAALYSSGFSEFQTNNWWLLIATCGVAVVTQIIVLCFKKIARSVPINYICLGTFTLCMSYVISYLCAYTKQQSEDGASAILVAATMTLGITLALTCYAFKTKHDFTIMGGFLFCFGIIFVLFGIFLAFQFSRTAYIIYSTFGCLLYSLYLIYDTQLIAGKGRYKLKVDDYVVGALYLYIDVVGLFIEILSLLGSSK